ncbi:MAG: hypothetical protein JW751_02765 [Polyangiaceae bacterium]|nr:hypothetical protein [Polyangiaceae bacterium]
MSGPKGFLWLSAVLLTACSGWRREQVSANVIDRLECSRDHVVVKGPRRAGVSDGLAEVAPNTKVWRGACDLWWDERIVMTCDRSTKQCTVLDLGAPHQRPKDTAR